MAITLVQSTSVATSAASPVLITPTFTNPTKPGNFLVLVLSLTGTALSITTPAGWSSVDQKSSAGILAGLFVLPNNAGGITSVAVTIADTTGGASAALFEFNGIGPNASLEGFGDGSATGTSFGATALPAYVPDNNELSFFVVGFAAAVLTPLNTPDWTGPVATAVSTNGVPNAQIACFYSFAQQGNLSNTGGSFNASVAFAIIQVRYFNEAKSPVVNTTNYGGRGIYVGAFNQGMIGG